MGIKINFTKLGEFLRSFNTDNDFSQQVLGGGGKGAGGGGKKKKK